MIDLDGNLISKPKSRREALDILQRLNGKKASVNKFRLYIKNGSMIWNYTDTSSLTMKKLSLEQIKEYLKKIRDKELYAYGVYQIEAGGKSLFSKIEGNKDSIMGLPIDQIKDYINTL